MFFNFLMILGLCVMFGIVFSYIIGNYIPSAQEIAYQNDNLSLHQKYESLQRELDFTVYKLDHLQENDDKIYRVIFEAEPIPPEIRKAGAGGSLKYDEMMRRNLEEERLIVSTLKKVEQVKRRMYIQTKSYDEIVELANSKNHMLKCIPAIQPITNKELNRLASGYGMRYHPILKIRRMHSGIDFSAPIGTPIYATGDGKVSVISRVTGYGKQIEIDHGYGYKTKYAHMSEFAVEHGQEVKRGQIIGMVGNTGLSSGPHLHYEVIYKNAKINPINYFTSGLEDDEIDKLLELASKENSSLGF